jgi:hypothetical protein
MRIAGAIVLIVHGAIGVFLDDVIIPTKRGAFHLHGLAGWVMAAAMLCAAIALLAVVMDHYDRRDNEAAYKRFGKWTARLGWTLTGLAMGLQIAGVHFPEPTKLTPFGVVAGIIIFFISIGVGWANEMGVERAKQCLPPKPGSPNRYQPARAGLGLLLMTLGTLALLGVLPGIFQFKFISYAVATIAIACMVLGWLLFATRARPEEKPRVEPVRSRRWRAVRIGVLLVAGLWAIWYVKSSQMGQWLAEDEAERLRAPVWNYHFDDFAAGIPLAGIQKHLTAEGFRMRCYGDLEKREKISPDDTDVCWTIANSTDGIPSRMIVFFFGQDGLRHIRQDFPKEQWPAVRDWVQRQGDAVAGGFGYDDQGGGKLQARRGKTGLIVVSEPGFSGWVMVMWQAREHVLERACKKQEPDRPQWQMLCRDWPPSVGPAPFLVRHAQLQSS